MTAADWDELGDRHYRKREIYTDLLWTDESGKEINLNSYVVVGCPFGGPIALIPDERKRSQVMRDMTFIRIYTSSAQLISSFVWQHRGLIKLGWTEEQHLVVVLEDATIIIYDIHGKQLRYFCMGQECSDAHIADAYIWSTGVVVRTAGDYFQFWAQLNLLDSDSHAFSLCNPNIERPPVFMTAIIDSDDISVLISTGDGGIYCVSRSACTKLLEHSGGAIMRMCLSANGRMIAIIDENMNLIVTTRDFLKQASSFSVRASKQPLAMAWCGSDAVVLVFNNDQIICAASNEFIPYPYSNINGNNRIILIPEIDSIRIITANKCEILSIVPFSTQDIFSYGSREPASLLYDSFEDFDAKDARADSQRRQIDIDAMEDAVIDCLDAAKYELQVIEYQCALLRACKYGKLFITNQDQFDCDTFVETCRFLRVLNSIRDINIGMPLTYIQFEILTPEVVVQRLINAKHHLLAIKISKYLGLTQCVNAALEHWAICKIESVKTQSTNDKDLVSLIRDKITCFSSNFSYAKIARCAQRRSVGLAAMLLDYEPRVKVQINCLVEFSQFIVALKKSLLSLDHDLIMKTLIELISKYSDNKSWYKLFEIIYSENKINKYGDDSPFNVVLNNILISTFIHLLMSADASHRMYKELLHKFLITTPNDEGSAQQNIDLLSRNNLRKSLLLLKNGNLGLIDDVDDEEDDTKECLHHLEFATRNYEKLRNKFNVQMCSDLKRIIIFQKEFDKKMLISGDEVSTLGLSINDTLYIMLQHGEEKYAEKIKREMFITDKRWWFILINVYCKEKQFDKLSKYIDRNTNTRRPPPCGYLPIIEALLEADQNDLAKQYILRLADIDEKLEWLCQLKFWMDAVDIATDDRDFDALQTIKINCNDDEVIKRINDLFNNLK